MSDETVSPAPKSSARHADQDQDIANFISAAVVKIETVRLDPEIGPQLATRGYNDTGLGEGITLQQAAQAAYTARQTAMSAKTQAVSALNQAAAAARATYADFRETARGIFPAASDRIALGLNGSVLKDQQKFITQARASYQAAQNEPYAARLAIYGFPREALVAALATLDALSTADALQNTVLGEASKATADRDAAYAALDAWVRQFNHIAKVALRNRPDLLKKLNA
jgi:hypothetical protein